MLDTMLYNQRVKMKKNIFVTVLLICMVLIISLTVCETKAIYKND